MMSVPAHVGPLVVEQQPCCPGEHRQHQQLHRSSQHDGSSGSLPLRTPFQRPGCSARPIRNRASQNHRSAQGTCHPFDQRARAEVAEGEDGATAMAEKVEFIRTRGAARVGCTRAGRACGIGRRLTGGHQQSAGPVVDHVRGRPPRVASRWRSGCRSSPTTSKVPAQRGRRRAGPGRPADPPAQVVQPPRSSGVTVSTMSGIAREPSRPLGPGSSRRTKRSGSAK